MSRLEDTSETVRWRSVGKIVLLLVSTLVGAIGFVSTTASLIVGFGFGESYALKLAVLFGGALLLAVSLGLFARRDTATHSWTLAGSGIPVATVGLALFWTTVPEGWSGSLGGFPPVASGAYAAGLLAVFGAVITADPSGASSETEQDSGGLGGFDSIVSSDDDER